MSAGEPLGADRPQTMFQHRRRTGVIRVRGFGSETGKQVYPAADEVLFFSRTTPDRLIRRDRSWLGTCEVLIVTPAELERLAELIDFSNAQGPVKEIVVKTEALNRFGPIAKDMWREVRSRTDPKNKLGRGKRQ